ncbi:protein phosphatase 1E-like [Argonauta hians]
MASYGNDQQSYRRFLDNFCQHLRSKRRSTGVSNLAEDEPDKKVQLFYEYIVECEVEAETLEWIRQYLHQHNCPTVLAAYIARCTCDEILHKDLSHLYRISTEDSAPQQIIARALLKQVVSQVHEVCLLMQAGLPKLKVCDTQPMVSVCAVRNFRRKMEDRHTVIPDLNTLFALQGYPSQSYYAVYDGHSGVEAAVYTMTHLHTNMVHSPYFVSDVPSALQSSYKLTDKRFVEKSKRERLKSGTTGISALIRGSTIYVSWLGDSQAVLVRNSEVLDMTMPHTPARQDEKKRIEDLGGIVLLVHGVSRVNGNFSVSRAIGDADQKPCISSDADVVTYELDGSEDYLMLACDGAWDYLDKQMLPYLVYNHVQKNNGQFSTVAEGMIKSARENGSKDNISVVVVFFREELSDPHSADLSHAVRENGENQKHDDGNPNRPPTWNSSSSSSSRCDSSTASPSPQRGASNPASSNNGVADHVSESESKCVEAGRAAYTTTTATKGVCGSGGGGSKVKAVSQSYSRSSSGESSSCCENPVETIKNPADSRDPVEDVCQRLLEEPPIPQSKVCSKRDGRTDSSLRANSTSDPCLKSKPLISGPSASVRVPPLLSLCGRAVLGHNSQLLSGCCPEFAEKSDILRCLFSCCGGGSSGGVGCGAGEGVEGHQGPTPATCHQTQPLLPQQQGPPPPTPPSYHHDVCLLCFMEALTAVEAGHKQATGLYLSSGLLANLCSQIISNNNNNNSLGFNPLTASSGEDGPPLISHKGNNTGGGLGPVGNILKTLARQHDQCTLPVQDNDGGDGGYTSSTYGGLCRKHHHHHNHCHTISPLGAAVNADHGGGGEGEGDASRHCCCSPPASGTSQSHTAVPPPHLLIRCLLRQMLLPASSSSSPSFSGCAAPLFPTTTAPSNILPPLSSPPLAS